VERRGAAVKQLNEKHILQSQLRAGECLNKADKAAARLVTENESGAIELVFVLCALCALVVHCLAFAEQ
jgi:hypothetical protein